MSGPISYLPHRRFALDRVEWADVFCARAMAIRRLSGRFASAVRMPCDQTAPRRGNQLCPLTHITRRVEQEKYTRGERLRPQGVDGRKPAHSKMVGPMFQFQIVAALSERMVVIDDQAARLDEWDVGARWQAQWVAMHGTS
jgi:hypothetical protein